VIDNTPGNLRHTNCPGNHLRDIALTDQTSSIPSTPNSEDEALITFMLTGVLMVVVNICAAGGCRAYLELGCSRIDVTILV
jgi:hypothetical protein